VAPRGWNVRKVRRLWIGACGITVRTHFLAPTAGGPPVTVRQIGSPAPRHRTAVARDRLHSEPARDAIASGGQDCRWLAEPAFIRRETSDSPKRCRLHEVRCVRSTRGLAGVGLPVESLPVSRGKHSADLNLAVRLDAVPHTVPGTYAEPISWQSWCSSTRRVGVSCRGSISAAVPLRGLSDAGADLQLLRPGSNLLCRGLRSASPTLLASVCRTALPEWSDGATPPCRATRSLPGARQKSDASRFTPIGDG
jgi:hypothetical protein